MSIAPSGAPIADDYSMETIFKVIDKTRKHIWKYEIYHNAWKTSARLGISSFYGPHRCLSTCNCNTFDHFLPIFVVAYFSALALSRKDSTCGEFWAKTFEFYSWQTHIDRNRCSVETRDALQDHCTVSIKDAHSMF